MESVLAFRMATFAAASSVGDGHIRSIASMMSEDAPLIAVLTGSLIKAIRSLLLCQGERAARIQIRHIEEPRSAFVHRDGAREAFHFRLVIEIEPRSAIA